MGLVVDYAFVFMKCVEEKEKHGKSLRQKYFDAKTLGSVLEAKKYCIKF